VVSLEALLSEDLLYLPVVLVPGVKSDFP